MTFEEFEARMEVFHLAMQLGAINVSGLAMGALLNPDPKAAAFCAASIPRAYDHATAVLADLKRDWEASQSDRETK